MTGLSSQQELTLLRKRARRRLVGAVAMTLLAVVVLWNVVDSKPQQDMHPESVEIVAASGTPIKSAAAKPAAPDESAMPMPVEPVSPAPAKPAAVPPKPAVADAAGAPLKPAPKADAPKPEAHPVPAKEAKPATAKAESKPVPEHKEAKPAPKAEAKPEAKPAPKTADVKQESKPEPKPERKSDPAAILAGKFDEAEPAKTKAADKSADKPKSAGGHFVIQVAALSDADKARELKQKLAGAGVNAQVSKVQTSKGEVSRVRVGPFTSQDEARAALARINKAGVSGIVVPQ